MKVLSGGFWEGRQGWASHTPNTRLQKGATAAKVLSGVFPVPRSSLQDVIRKLFSEPMSFPLALIHTHAVTQPGLQAQESPSTFPLLTSLFPPNVMKWEIPSPLHSPDALLSSALKKPSRLGGQRILKGLKAQGYKRWYFQHMMSQRKFGEKGGVRIAWVPSYNHLNSLEKRTLSFN